MTTYVDRAWMTDAACLDTDTDLFFPSEGSTRGHVNRAVSVCERCNVRDECLDYALRWKLQDGVWGGLSASERRGMGRRTDLGSLEVI